MRDRDVRRAVRKKLVAEYAGDETTSIVEEMGVWSGSVRIDIAVINGELCGYELKSDRDTLQRLPFQAELYSKVFDRVTLVVGTRHARAASVLIPEWWGILIATRAGDEVELEPCQRPHPNPSPDPYLVAQLLWKEEALRVLEQFDLARGWRAKRVKAIHQRLADNLSFDVLRAQVRSALKMRNSWLRQVMPSDLDVSIHTNPDPVL